MSDAREIAYEITRRVNSMGGYLGLLLRYGMTAKDLERRDRALISELTYGVQRHRARLDFVIASFSSRPLAEIDPEVLDICRLGVYQLAEMRIPQHAAVNETVKLAKKRLGKREASFVNALLRAASGGLEEIKWPGRDDLPFFLETVYSHPRWLVDYMLRLLGPEEAEALCVADNTMQRLTLRANTARNSAPSLLGEITERGGEGSISPCFSEALVGVKMPHETLLDLLRKGQCVVQDESSMLVSHVVDPAAGDMVIDACAAPGGKATHIALLGGTGCRLIAVDKNERRMEAMRKTVSRLGISNIETIVGDSTRLQDLLSEKAAIIIVDAPCSGLGTLRRNPELKWRRTPEDLDELKRLQISLLCGCSDNLAPGGALVYSVCTFTAEETTGVIEEFLRDRRDFKPADATPYLPEALRDSADGDGFIQIMPHKHGMEGMFIARLERN